MIPPSIGAYTTKQNKMYWLLGGRIIYAQLESLSYSYVTTCCLHNYFHSIYETELAQALEKNFIFF